MSPNFTLQDDEAHDLRLPCCQRGAFDRGARRAGRVAVTPQPARRPRTFLPEKTRPLLQLSTRSHTLCFARARTPSVVAFSQAAFAPSSQVRALRAAPVMMNLAPQTAPVRALSGAATAAIAFSAAVPAPALALEVRPTVLATAVIVHVCSATCFRA